MPKEFPVQFLERLEMIIPPRYYEGVLNSFAMPLSQVFRVNTLKISFKEAARQFEGMNKVEPVPEAFTGDECLIENLKKAEVFDRGILYQQNLSSMLAVEVLDPRPGERILDLCAAPGSKTSQIAARMDNSGEIMAVEAVRSRFYRLRFVLNLLGVTNTKYLCMDGRRFQARDGLFDRVLVDAPCSSEGRFKHANPKSYAYWSLRKIKEMVKKQRGLLFNAGRQLKMGGTLVYSTCTFAPEENEGVVDWFLRKTEGQFIIEPVFVPGVDTYSVVMSWGKRDFDEQVQGCLRVLPSGLAEGFFITKFKKIS